MARASFGGSSDYSSLFASVYGNSTGTGSGNPDIAASNKLQYEFDAGTITLEQYKAGLTQIAQKYAGGINDQKYYQYMDAAATATERTSYAQQQAKADLAATDADMQSQWQNGVISNDAWLAYVANRASTATDPKEQAKWSGYLLKFKQQIGDTTAEYNYQNGGSVNDLISYYQTKIAGMDPNSQDTQKDKLRLNDLLDTRSNTAISDGAQKILDAIKTNKATYEDLLKFEQGALGTVRPNSAMETQLKGEIEKITQTIADNKSSEILGKAEYDFKTNHLTGKAYAAIIEAQAAQYKTSDPSKYYQFMSTANDYRTKSPGLANAGSVGAAARAAAAKTHDVNLGTREYGKWYTEQYDAWYKKTNGVGAPPTLIGPDRTKVTLTPDFIATWDKKVLASFDSDASLSTAKGDTSGAKGYAAEKASYLLGTVRFHNTMPVAEQSLHLATARNTQLNLYEGSVGLNIAGKYAPQGAVDAVATNKVFTDWLNQDAKALTTATHTTTSKVVNTPNNEMVVKGVGAEKTGLNALDPGYIAQQQATIAALKIANTPGATPEQLDAARQALAAAYTNAAGEAPKVPDFILRSFDAMAQNSENVAGQQTGTRSLVLNVAGNLQWVDTAPKTMVSYGPTGKMTGSAIEPVMSQAGYTTDGGTKVVDALVDINGVPTHVKAIAHVVSSDLQVWKVGSKGLTIPGKNVKLDPGTVLTSAMIKQLDDKQPDWRTFAGSGPSGSAYFKDFANEGVYYQLTIKGGTLRDGTAIPPQTLTQDPGTLQWYKGDQLPISHVSREADGTVTVTTSGPQITFKPDYGQAVPYVGFNRKAAQTVLNEDGTIDTSGLKGRDANGTVTANPVHPASTSLYDPTQPDLGPPVPPKPGQQDPFEAADAGRQTRAINFRRAEIVNGMKSPDFIGSAPSFVAGPSPATSAGDRQAKNPFAAISDFGTSIGLNIGGGLLPPPSAASESASQARNTAFVPSFTPATYSGPNFVPTAANLPSATAKPVTLPTVQYSASNPGNLAPTEFVGNTLGYKPPANPRIPVPAAAPVVSKPAVRQAV
jgi:hypothetical protein